jgi:uncharacterized delta-60 repeat protein
MARAMTDLDNTTLIHTFSDRLTLIKDLSIMYSSSASLPLVDGLSSSPTGPAQVVSTLSRMLLYVVMMAALSFTTASSQVPDYSFSPVIGGTSGGPAGISQRADGRLVVFGVFDVIGGLRRSKIAILNGDETVDAGFDAGVILAAMPSLETSITSASSQTDNKLVISGYFAKINGIAANSIARLGVDGSIDGSFNAGQGPNYSISKVLALPTGNILVCGDFTKFDNQSSPPLIRLNSDGTIDHTFGAVINGFSVSNFVVQPDGKIIAVGDIYSISNGAFQGIVRLNPNGSIDPTFNPGAGAENYILQMALQPDGKLLISGDFSSYSGSPRIAVARLNSNGSLDGSFVADTTNSGGVGVHVNFNVLDDGKILIGGAFDNVNGTRQPQLARLNANGAIDLSYRPIFNPSTSTLTNVTPGFRYQDGRLIIFGNFLNVNQTMKIGMAKLNSDGTTDPGFDLSAKRAGTVVTSATGADGKLYIGGVFGQINGVTEWGIARINADGSTDRTFNSGTGSYDLSTSGYGKINTISVQNDGRVFVGGDFRVFNGVIQPNNVRLNADGSLDTSFSRISGTGEIKDSIVQNDGKILFAGTSSLWRLNIDGSADTTFNTGTVFNGSTYKIQVQADGKIIVAGIFTSVNGVPRKSIARLNSNGSLDLTYDTSAGPNSYVYSCALQNDGKVVLVGAFTTINGIPRNKIGRLDTNGSLDPSFDPGQSADGQINSISVFKNNNILIGGYFSNFAGVARKRLALLGPTGALITNGWRGIDFDMDGQNPSYIGPITHYKNTYYVGGVYTKLNDQIATSLSRITFAGTASFDYDADGKTDESVFRPSTNVWYLNRSQTGFTGYQFGAARDLISPADFTGDGKTDVAVFRPSTGTWFVLKSEDNTFYGAQFGSNGDLPAPADYDGDGKADTAVFRPSAGTWFIQRSTAGFISTAFGANGDVPTVGDFDGDGKADVAVFRPSNGTWYRLNSSTGLFAGAQFGQTGDQVVAADYTGDGKTDLAVWRPSNGTWYIMRSEDNSFYGAQFGVTSDLPTPGDYDGDGKADISVFRPSIGTWFEQRSTSGFAAVQFGTNGDKPTPNAFVY